jgi:hypothetical protein
MVKIATWSKNLKKKKSYAKTTRELPSEKREKLMKKKKNVDTRKVPKLSNKNIIYVMLLFFYIEI